MADSVLFRVTNFDKYQHYRDKRVPWIKWHIKSLNNPDFMALPDQTKWLAVAFTTLTSEFEKTHPDKWLDLRSCSFRLRREIDIAELHALEKAGFITFSGESRHSLESVYTPSRQSVLERERERERERDKKHCAIRASRDACWDTFWTAYPKRNGIKRGKAAALKAWKAIPKGIDLDTILKALQDQINHKAKCEEIGLFCAEFPDPVRWIKHRQWETELEPPKKPAHKLSMHERSDAALMAWAARKQEETDDPEGYTGVHPPDETTGRDF